VRNMTPRNYKSYPIWTPAGSAEIIAQNEVYFNAHRLNYSSSRSIASSGSHRVRRGENLITISKKYNVSVFQLKRKNRLRSNRILIGQRLKIPSHAQRNKKYHSVRSGDALVLISRKYGISVSKLKQLNNIDNNLIYVGQKLLVNENI